MLRYTLQGHQHSESIDQCWTNESRHDSDDLFALSHGTRLVPHRYLRTPLQPHGTYFTGFTFTFTFSTALAVSDPMYMYQLQGGSPSRDL